MKLYPFADEGRETALRLLIEGFPERLPDFWTRGLDRVLAHARRFSPGRAGYLMEHKGNPVGVMLTLESPAAFGGPSRVNLSSWYVAEQARWLAPKMLADITSRPDVCFTDLTASPSAQKLNEHLGFRVFSRGARIVPLMAAALLPARGAHLMPVPADAPRRDPLGRVLVDHARYGAISVHLNDDEGIMPLVVVRTPGRAPIGRVLLAPEPRRVVRHIGPIARHLLRRGLMFLEIESAAARDLPVSFETPRRCRTYVKGPHHAGPGLDHSYSELAVLPP